MPFYGYLGPRRPAAAWLLRAASEAPDRGGGRPGWGLGWIAGDQAELRAGEVPAVDDPAFRAAAELASGEAVVAAFAGPGQPVRFHRWLLAVDGQLPDLAGLRERLVEAVPEALRHQLPLAHDAGLLLGLVLGQLQARGATGPPDAARLRSAVAQALEQATRAAAEAWSAALPAQGCVCTNGALLVGVRRGGALRWQPVTHGGVRVASRVSPDTKGWDALGPESIMSVTVEGGPEQESREAAAARDRPPETRRGRRFGL